MRVNEQPERVPLLAPKRRTAKPRASRIAHRTKREYDECVNLSTIKLDSISHMLLKEHAVMRRHVAISTLVSDILNCWLSVVTDYENDVRIKAMLPPGRRAAAVPERYPGYLASLGYAPALQQADPLPVPPVMNPPDPEPAPPAQQPPLPLAAHNELPAEPHQELPPWYSAAGTGVGVFNPDVHASLTSGVRLGIGSAAQAYALGADLRAQSEGERA
jgi:hypothetical protein